MEYKYLEKVNSPSDLKKLSFSQLEELAQEIRYFLVDSISQTGGHLSSNLGSVELTLAMHNVFDCPKDQFVWDVGHQAYTHKILTGRRDLFSTLRQENGLSGFPRESESEYDSFLSGHASTSISVACGLAYSKAVNGDDGYVVAVIGDGALTGGQSYEALNNAGRSEKKLIVIINDNEMSISKNVGALAKHLTQMRTRQGYFDLKDSISRFLQKLPLIGIPMRKLISNTKKRVKDAIYNSNIFENFGFVYLGPTDGHDIPQLCRVLARAKKLNRPVVVHVNTKKGKGCTFAENDPSKYHGVGKFDAKTGEFSSSKESYTAVFGEKLVELASKDNRICAVTAAMKSSTGLDAFADKFNDRFFDVGIAEEHAVTFSAAMAKNGIVPVCAIYSTFLQRGYDQILHDTCIENRHVVFAVDRAGIVGEDGVTHQGLFDVAFMNQMPNMTIFSPSDYDDLSLCIETAVEGVKGPVSVRYPRGAQPKIAQAFKRASNNWEHFDAENDDVLLISYGRLFGEVAKAADELGVSAIKIVKVLPIDEECINKAMQYKRIFFFEEGIRRGSVAEGFMASLNVKGYKGDFNINAVEGFVHHASVARSFEKLGFDADSIIKTVKEKGKL